MFKAVIFDVDGTLLDTERVYMQAWRVAGAQRGYDIAWDTLVRTRAVPMSVTRQVMHEAHGPDFPVEEIMAERYRLAEIMIPQIPGQQLLKPGAVEVLEHLKSKGIPMAVASSTAYDKTIAHLDHTGLTHYFPVKLGGDMVKQVKPAPDLFLLAAQQLGLSPQDCLVVGDSPADVKAAVAAGMQVVLIPDTVPLNPQTQELSAYVFQDLFPVIQLFP